MLQWKKISKQADEDKRSGRGWGQWSARTLEQGPEQTNRPDVSHLDRADDS